MGLSQTKQFRTKLLVLGTARFIRLNQSSKSGDILRTPASVTFQNVETISTPAAQIWT